jgi:hypothetical protein
MKSSLVLFCRVFLSSILELRYDGLVPNQQYMLRWSDNVRQESLTGGFLLTRSGMLYIFLCQFICYFCIHKVGKESTPSEESQIKFVLQTATLLSGTPIWTIGATKRSMC